tara:strand:+ start:664 stop:1821 length:1158 start_codon:yes stop_codon:yes gene_type:complete
MPKKLSRSNVRTKVIRGGLQNFNSLKKRMKEFAVQDEFYELEAVEVLEVHLDSANPSFPTKEDGTPDYQYLGGIIGRFVETEQGLHIDKCKDFKSINPNFNNVPAVGEIVVGVRYLGQLFFDSQLNLFGNPNSNLQHGISKIKRKNTLASKLGKLTANAGDEKGIKMGYYLDDGRDKDARRLLPNEGDVVIEGRFGNTIRLGSDLVNGNTESPNIILNVGQSKDEFPNPKEPVEEIIDTDGSSIYLTTNQELEFTPAIESKVVQSPYKDKNIFIGSDRILFNTFNGGDIGMFSANNISIGSVNKVVLETPQVKIGSDDASEPQVLGQTLYDRLDALVTAIGGVIGIPTPVGPTPGPISAAGNWSAVVQAMAAVKDSLSEQHKIDK